MAPFIRNANYDALSLFCESFNYFNTNNGIDCDGAGVSVTRCNVINNHVYNVGESEWASGLFLENCFECLIQGNTVHDIINGAGMYVVNYGNGTGWHTKDNIEYRDKNTNTIIKDNVVYEYPTNPGILVIAVIGLVIDHNTFYNIPRQFYTAPSIAFLEAPDDAGVIYPSKNETITNNIFFSRGVVWDQTTPATGFVSNNFTGDPLFVNATAGDFHLQPNSPACTGGLNRSHIGAFPCH